MVIDMTGSIVDNEKNFPHFGTTDIGIESMEVKLEKGPVIQAFLLCM